MVAVKKAVKCPPFGTMVTGQLTDTPTCRLVSSQTGQLED